MVEESPGKLEYEVALFRESGAGVSGGGGSGAESPVEQAVPIGTKLQLRATIGANSGMDLLYFAENCMFVLRSCLKVLASLFSMEARETDGGDHFPRRRGRLRQGTHHAHRERVHVLSDFVTTKDQNSHKVR